MSSALNQSCSHLLSTACVSPPPPLSLFLFFSPYEANVAPCPSSVSTSPPLFYQCFNPTFLCMVQKIPSTYPSAPLSLILMWSPHLLPLGSALTFNLWIDCVCSLPCPDTLISTPTGWALPTERPPPAKLGFFALIYMCVSTPNQIQAPGRPSGEEVRLQMRSRARGVLERQQILDICGFDEGQTQQPPPRQTGKGGQQLRPSVPQKKKKANHLRPLPNQRGTTHVLPTFPASKRKFKARQFNKGKWALCLAPSFHPQGELHLLFPLVLPSDGIVNGTSVVALLYYGGIKYLC